MDCYDCEYCVNELPTCKNCGTVFCEYDGNIADELCDQCNGEDDEYEIQ